MRKLLVLIIAALVVALIATTMILASSSVREADATIERIDRKIAINSKK